MQLQTKKLVIHYIQFKCLVHGVNCFIIISNKLVYILNFRWVSHLAKVIIFLINAHRVDSWRIGRCNKKMMIKPNTNWTMTLYDKNCCYNEYFKWYLTSIDMIHANVYTYKYPFMQTPTDLK